MKLLIDEMIRYSDLTVTPLTGETPDTVLNVLLLTNSYLHCILCKVERV